MFSVQRLPVVSFIITDRCDARAPRDLSLLKGEEVKVKDYGTHVDAVVIIICAPQTFLSRARIREFVLAQKINKRLREMMMPSLYFFLSTKFKASARIELIEDGAYFFSHPVHDTNRCRRVRPLYTRQMVWDAFINCIASQCAHSCIQRNVRMDGSSLRSCVENTSWRSSGGDTHFPIYTIHKYIRERERQSCCDDGDPFGWRRFSILRLFHQKVIRPTVLSTKLYLFRREIACTTSPAFSSLSTAMSRSSIEIVCPSDSLTRAFKCWANAAWNGQLQTRRGHSLCTLSISLERKIKYKECLSLFPRQIQCRWR